ncbi:MAG TPA: hypothetical protein VKV74_00260 [Bryobacteraceae bacterium]|nr:hypothetical protein [Bryobacteraceae bacterium]
MSRDYKTDHRQAVAEMIQGLEEGLRSSDGKVKGTLGDYIRLLQLEREMEAEAPADIEVKWVESENFDQ